MAKKRILTSSEMRDPKQRVGRRVERTVQTAVGTAGKFLGRFTVPFRPLKKALASRKQTSGRR